MSHHDNCLFGHSVAHQKGRGYCMSIPNFKGQRLSNGAWIGPKVTPSWFEGQMPEDEVSTNSGPDYDNFDPRNATMGDDVVPGTPLEARLGHNAWAKKYVWLPYKFPRVGAPLRVPKCVIISIMPNWTLMTTETWQFHFPRDVIGNLLLYPDKTLNYYYLTQWDVYTVQSDPIPEVHCGVSVQWRDSVQSTLASNLFYHPSKVPEYNEIQLTQDDIYYCLLNGNFPDDVRAKMADDYYYYSSTIDLSNMQRVNSEFTDMGEKNLKKCMTKEDGIFPEGSSDRIHTGTDKAALRGGTFNEVVATVDNKYAIYRRRFKDYCLEPIQAFAESQKIHLICPDWIPDPFPELRNDYLINGIYRYEGRPWLDATKPCATTCPVAWGPAFPDPRGLDMEFAGEPVPWLLCPPPGFGVNVLHIYVGHPNMNFTGGTAGSVIDYQAWPFSPEMGYLGPVPFYAYYPGEAQLKAEFDKYSWGRRPLWRDYGYDYGYTGAHTVDNLLEYYADIWQTAAAKYRDNFPKYRNIVTKIYTIGCEIDFTWTPVSLENDHVLGCESPFFYFGYTDFGFEVAEEMSKGGECFEDILVDRMPESPESLHIATRQSYLVGQCELTEAMRDTFPILARRVEEYYSSIAPGSDVFFENAVQNIEGVEFNGRSEPSPSAAWFINIISEHFKLKK